MLNRNIIEKVNRCLANFPVVVLAGCRQSGKTTLARMVRPQWRYFDMEKGSDFDLITRDYDFFFRQYPGDLIIDEAQSHADLFKELRGVVDADRSRKGRFILTGSSSLELTRQVAESLAGRVAVVEVGTLKMNERYAEPLPPIYALLDQRTTGRQLGELKQLPVSFDSHQVLNHFLKGGYPEPTVDDRDAFRAEWMTHYQQSYVQGDIRRLFPQLKTENYRRFVTMLSDLSGTIVNRSEVGRTLGVSESAVRDYLDIAEGTFIWRNVPSLERTVSKSVVKMPRGYFRDSGLLHHLLNIRNLEQVFTRSGTGVAFEGFVMEEMVQGLKSVESAPWRFQYYRTRGGAEVDLIMISPTGQRIPVEIKFGASVRRAELRSLSMFIDQEQCAYGMLVNQGDEVRMLTDKIIQMPVGCF